MQKTILRCLSLSLIASGVLIAAGANAATTNGTIAVSANVATNCALVTTPVAFGAYDPLAVAPQDATGTLELTCTTGATPSVALDAGANASGTQRRLINGVSFLNYDLYQPSTTDANAACAFTTPYDATGFVLTPAPDANPRTFNVCGRIPAGQAALGGTYSDVVNVTVTF
jgi:spore coat protein U-like protein